jgi:hypothetical protein
MRATFAREELPPAPPPRSPAPRTPGILARLLAPEPLPPPPEPEQAAGTAAGPERGLLSLLFGPDPLPSDLPPVPRRPSRWPGWLFAPEKLEP